MALNGDSRVKYLLASFFAGAYTVFGYLFGLVLAGICIGTLNLNQLYLMVFFTWASPLFVGLLIFRPLLVSRRLHSGYIHSLRWILIVEIISVNLVLGIAAPLFDLLRKHWIGFLVEDS